MPNGKPTPISIQEVKSHAVELYEYRRGAGEEPERSADSTLALAGRRWAYPPSAGSVRHPPACLIGNEVLCFRSKEGTKPNALVFKVFLI